MIWSTQHRRLELHGMSMQQHTINVWEQAARSAAVTFELPGDVPMFFERIVVGEYLMGSRGNRADEEPIHRVEITRDFFLIRFFSLANIRIGEQSGPAANGWPIERAPRPQLAIRAERPKREVKDLSTAPAQLADLSIALFQSTWQRFGERGP